jgi:hypothetical protein
MIFTAINWTEFFETLPSIDDANRAMAELVEASEISSGKSEDELLAALVEDPETVVMAYVPPTKSILLLHHVTKLGGTRLTRDTHYVGLSGFGRSASPVLLTEKSLQDTVSVATPTPTRLMTLTTPDQLASTLAPLNNGPRLENRTYMILPPFLANIFISKTDLRPEELFIDALSAIQEFDTAYASISSMPKAADACKAYLQFLWACAHDEVSPLEMYPSTASHITSWCEDLHSKHILSPVIPSNSSTGPVFGGPSDSTMADLTKTLSEQIQEMEKSRASRELSSSEKKTSFSNLFESTQNMILNASSSNGMVASAVPSDEAISFFKQTNVAKARIWLDKKLESDYSCHVGVNPAMVTNIYSGNFLRSRSDTPSNFSIFSLMKPISNHSVSERECMMLNLKLTHGKGVSDEDLATWTKQAIRICIDIPEALHALRNTRCCATIFFKSTSMIVVSIKSWERHIQANLISYEDRAVSNPQFLAMLMYAVDTRLYLWLKSCESSALEQRDTVDDSLIDFTQMQSHILTGNFYQELPSCIRQASPKGRKLPSNGDESDDGGGKNKSSSNKKRRGTEQGKSQPGAESERINNPEPVQAWKIDYETYKSKFAGKNLKKRVKWGDCYMCVRYFTVGYCFENCFNIATHVTKQSDIPTEKKAAFAAFCKLCNP